jgi:hypothetical protein
MAARKLKITNKLTKKTGGGKTAEYLSDLKVMGDEPTFSPLVEITDIEYLRALQWYNTMCTRDTARKYTETYLKKLGRTSDCVKLKQIPDVWFSVQTGWIARMAIRGVKLKQRTLNAFETLLSESFTKIPQVKEQEEAKRPTVNVQERIADKASALMFDLEKLIDTEGYSAVFSAYDWLTKNEASASVVPHFIRFFKPIADEAQELLSSKCDPQLKEGYRKYTKAQLKVRADFYSKLMSDLERFAGNIKKQRAPRVKKIITPDKKLKNFKFLKENNEFRLASINPEKIFDADELWMFHTKYKIFTVLRCSPDSKFEVSGLSIKNFDYSKSKSYRLGRKAEEVVDTLNKAGKRALVKIVDNLKETELQTRSSEYTILMKVI